jgi:hypothetical protein
MASLSLGCILIPFRFSATRRTAKRKLLGLGSSKATALHIEPPPYENQPKGGDQHHGIGDLIALREK